MTWLLGISFFPRGSSEHRPLSLRELVKPGYMHSGLGFCSNGPLTLTARGQPLVFQPHGHVLRLDLLLLELRGLESCNWGFMDDQEQGCEYSNSAYKWSYPAQNSGYLGVHTLFIKARDFMEKTPRAGLYNLYLNTPALLRLNSNPAA